MIVTSRSAHIAAIGIILCAGLAPARAYQHGKTLAPIQFKMGNHFKVIPPNEYVDVLKDGGPTWVLSFSTEVPKSSVRLIPMTVFNVKGRHWALDGKMIQSSPLYLSAPSLLSDYSTLAQLDPARLSLPAGTPVHIYSREEGYYLINFNASVFPQDAAQWHSGVRLGRVPVASVEINPGQNYVEETDALKKSEPDLVLSIPITFDDLGLRSDIEYTFNAYKNSIRDNAKEIADDPTAKKFGTKRIIAEWLSGNGHFAGRWYEMMAEQLAPAIPQLQAKLQKATDENDEKAMHEIQEDLSFDKTIVAESLEKVPPQYRKLSVKCDWLTLKQMERIQCTP